MRGRQFLCRPLRSLLITDIEPRPVSFVFAMLALLPSDTDKIEASFKNGVLTVRLPKKPEAIKPEKKIEIKTG
jgi:Hsp20/alpha crystallin family